MERERCLTNNIYDDLKEKMAFIGGPRQVGKTTLARILSERNSQILNITIGTTALIGKD